MEKGLIAVRRASKNSLVHRSIVELRVKLQACTRRKGALWLAWCPPLDVMTQAETEQRAIESLREAVELWFESCISRNVFDDALVEAGFSRLRPGDAVPGDSSIIGVHGQGSWPASRAAAGAEKQGRDAFARERDIEVSIPAYIAAQYDSSGNRRASH
jgi:predicted RNase H-like HicB family nuclease